MKVYLDIIFLLNIWFDFLLLISVSILLKRNIKLRKIFLGSLIGSLTFFILFIKMNNIILFVFKIFISIFMNIITFNYKNFKYTLTNIAYFYLSSIILGGGMYLFNDLLSFSNNGLIFYKNGFQINYIILIIISPIIIYFYIKNSLKLKNNYSNYHLVDIIYNNNIYHLNGYLDTGNNLFDIYKHRGIILISKPIKYNKKDIIYTPYNSLNHEGIIKCLKPNKIYIDKIEFKDYLIGISNDKFKIDGIDCILHNNMKGRLKWLGF